MDVREVPGAALSNRSKGTSPLNQLVGHKAAPGPSAHWELRPVSCRFRQGHHTFSVRTTIVTRRHRHSDGGIAPR
jgi:hypothetical protein